MAPKDERTDLDLLSASRSGDKDALAEIYSRYKPRGKNTSASNRVPSSGRRKPTAEDRRA